MFEELGLSERDRSRVSLLHQPDLGSEIRGCCLFQVFPSIYYQRIINFIVKTSTCSIRRAVSQSLSQRSYPIYSQILTHNLQQVNFFFGIKVVVREVSISRAAWTVR